MSDPFDAYKLPPGLVKGVEIKLEGTPAVFRVRLPSSFDEDFTTSVMVTMANDAEVQDRGAKPMDFEFARRQVFFNECILSADGLPPNMTAKEFFDAYPLAKREVYNVARDMVNQTDVEVHDALGKLRPSQNGKSSGGGARNSTKTSSKPGSRRKQPARK